MFKIGDIVKVDHVCRVIGSSLRRIKLFVPIEVEVIKAQKTSTYFASYVVKNTKTGLIEKTQYWHSELQKVS
jgi:hypothetical protein